MAVTTARRVSLPLPTTIRLRHFSLYGRRKTIEAGFDKQVYCLAGANGLGKSTFLAALNYAITGVVNEPGRRFLGASDFYDEVASYSQTFFDGRIRQRDHDAAQVELEMRVGTRHYSLTRGMFDPHGLRELTITNADGTARSFDEKMDDSERHRTYEEAILADSGLEDFSQLVFLQLFVLTFDEERRLLFWDKRTAQTALFIAFGGSAESARRAERLQRTVDSADSLVRNLQWQASGLRDQLDALKAVEAGSDGADEGLEERHQILQSSTDTAAAHYERITTALHDSSVRHADTSARLRAARAEYEAAYQGRLAGYRDAAGHPTVHKTVSTGTCDVCGAVGKSAVQAVQTALSNAECPLCGNELPEPAADPSHEEDLIQSLGTTVVELEAEASEGLAEVTRLQTESQKAEAELVERQAQLDSFRVANAKTLSMAGAEGSALHEATSGLQRQINELLTRKDTERSRRDKAKSALEQMQKELMQLYTQVESEFVPEFRGLASEFLGVDIEVDLDRRASSLQLRLALAEQDRREPDELSESQRFFIDIALRMALAKQLASPERPATLFIDTPEGSLDIAYERRAGRMFGRFVADADRLFMTANINTSKLLLELAATCGSEKMKLIRMTDWTSLSEVQQEAENDFEAAFAAIERALVG